MRMKSIGKVSISEFCSLLKVLILNASSSELVHLKKSAIFMAKPFVFHGL